MCYRAVVFRNITFSLPVELIKRAKVLAAQEDRSLNALVREVLEQKIEGSQKYREAGERLLKQSESGLYEMPPKVWAREDLYE